VVQITVLQIDCSTSESVAHRVERVLSLIEREAPGTDLMVLPELWHITAFDLAAARAHAQPLDGPLVGALATLARTHAIWLHGGSFCERDGDLLHNTSVLFDPSGQLVAFYRKIHVFTYAGEHETMAPGTELVVVETPLGLTGIATCYDLRFPEMFRAMTQAGAEAFLISSGWPTKRIGHWDALLPARAIENQAWVVASNQVGDQNGLALGGHSVVIDPLGTTVAHGGEGEQIIRASVDPDVGRTWRSEFPALRDIVEF
jgi:predicted amidohydrolase